MAWKKIAESNEIIVFENQLKKHKIKIEARKRNNGWEIFKTKIDGDSSNLISEHFIEDKKKALALIRKLKQDSAIYRKRNGILLRRVYKEEFIEKWVFSVDDDNIKNLLYIKFDSHIKVDIIMHEKYIAQEKRIIDQVEERLGLSEIGEAFSYEIYYFKRTNNLKKESDMPVNFLDIEFDFTEDYY
ncbi:MAG: hypothetical protein AABW92_00285 [Nanoarchaeota archaeon]